jgi:hypothetical protein
VNPSFDLEKYIKLLKPVASLSYLFSDNDVAYVNSKFVERLYVIASGAQNTASDNSSFDAVAPIKVGVGIKTFTSSKSARFENEKIAEFTRDANAGMFDGLNDEQLLRKAIELRNLRLASDANIYGLDISRAIYHCLIRLEGGAIIHEEPMSLVDIPNLKPVDGNGRVLKKMGDRVLLSDGVNTYSYSKSKRVLYKKFPVIMPPKPGFGGLINLPINRNILNEIGDGMFGVSPSSTGDFCLQDHPQLAFKSDSDESKEFKITEKPRDFVILPLYSTRGGKKEIPERSGINQWNADGRTRKFGEAYIPIPSWIYDSYPGFLPPRDTTFRLRLQDGTIQKAKICQDGGKALMTDPNEKLCEWFYKAIEPNLSYAKIQERLIQKRPYKYSDLVYVGKDSVKMKKARSGLGYDFELTFCSLGSFEEFKEIAEIKDNRC